MPRGGRRSGAPGKAYANRTDLNKSDALAKKTVPGQAYGAAQQQREAQSVIPVAGTPAPAPRVTPPSSGSGAVAGGPLPGALGFTDPSARPNEPVTAGVPVGPGPGPQALSLMQDNEDVLLQLREAYRLYPNAETRRLIERVERGIR